MTSEGYELLRASESDGWGRRSHLTGRPTEQTIILIVTFSE